MTSLPRYIWDVKTAVKAGDNSLMINFQSPVEFAKMMADSQTIPIPPACVPDEYHGECHANFIRKMQASFSWDWGPAFPSMGVWQPILLVASDFPRLDHITWSVVEAAEDMFTVSVTAGLHGPDCSKCEVTYVLNGLGSGVLSHNSGQIIVTYTVSQKYAGKHLPK